MEKEEEQRRHRVPQVWWCSNCEARLGGDGALSQTNKQTVLLRFSFVFKNFYFDIN